MKNQNTNESETPAAVAGEAPCSAELELATELEHAAARIRRLVTALTDANGACRSAYQVAARTGVNTNWNGLENSLKESLKRQHAAMYPPNDQGEAQPPAKNL